MTTVLLLKTSLTTTIYFHLALPTCRYLPTITYVHFDDCLCYKINYIQLVKRSRMFYLYLFILFYILHMYTLHISYVRFTNFPPAFHAF